LRPYRLHLVESGVGTPTIIHSLTALRFLFLATLRKPARLGARASAGMLAASNWPRFCPSIK
jgi:hypothetical protein